MGISHAGKALSKAKHDNDLEMIMKSNFSSVRHVNENIVGTRQIYVSFNYRLQREEAVAKE